jgi:hypothetical protein
MINIRMPTRSILLLLLQSSASDIVRALNTDCQITPDGYTTKIGTGCTQYVQCQGGLLASTHTCPEGLLFNGQYCDWASSVDCALDTTTAVVMADVLIADEELLCAPSIEDLTTSCSIGLRARSCASLPCPMEMFCFSFKCADATQHVDSDTVTNDTSIVLSSPNVYARALASNLHLMMEMQENFNHDADCSMADWTLCYTQNLLLDYWGNEDYSDR